MKRTVLLFSLLCCICNSIYAQKYKSHESEVSIFSEAPIENIEAINKKGQSVLDLSNQNIVFSIPSDGFNFEKELMQEHFNEKYMESDKFPKSIFSGKFSGFDIQVKGEQKVVAKGKLTIHGVARNVESTGTMLVQKDKIKLTSSFNVKLEDHGIAIPQVLWQNIAEEFEVKIEFKYTKIK